MTLLMKYLVLTVVLKCHIEICKFKGDLESIKDAPKSGRKNQQLLRKTSRKSNTLLHEMDDDIARFVGMSK